MAKSTAPGRGTSGRTGSQAGESQSGDAEQRISQLLVVFLLTYHAVRTNRKGILSMRSLRAAAAHKRLTEPKSKLNPSSMPQLDRASLPEGPERPPAKSPNLLLTHASRAFSLANITPASFL